MHSVVRRTQLYKSLQNLVYLVPSQFFVRSSKSFQIKNKPHPDGEWICDVWPNAKHILANQERLKESLVSRIYSSSEKHADEIFGDFKSKYEHFCDCYRIRTQLNQKLMSLIANNSSDTQPLSKLEFEELKTSEKKARASQEDARASLISLYATLPNFISKVVAPEKSKSLLEPNKELLDLIAECRCSDESVSLPYDDLEFSTGPSAYLDLHLTNFISDFLDSHGYTELSVPYIVRQEVVSKLDIPSLFNDTYTLQSKYELHAEADDNDMETLNFMRKSKPEDHYVFKALGVTDIMLILYFLRYQTSSQNLPIRTFAVGNQYRQPYTGKPKQSRVAAILSADTCEELAEESHIEHIKVVQTIFDNMGVNVTRKSVPPHLLLHHEATATEFILDSKTANQVVLSRLSLSNDFLSRRIMAASAFEDDKFVYFASGEVLDITLLIRHLQT